METILLAGAQSYSIAKVSLQCQQETTLLAMVWTVMAFEATALFSWIPSQALETVAVVCAYIWILSQLEVMYPIRHNTNFIQAWSFIIGTVGMQFVLLYMMIFLPPVPGSSSSIAWIPFSPWYEQNVPQALYSIALVTFFNVNLYKLALHYQSSFHHFCHAFFATYPFTLEFAVSEIASSSFVLSWVQTAAKYKMIVVEYVVQVNDLFIGRLDAAEKGMWVSGLEPGETYRVRVWARIESSWYPSRCTVIRTLSKSANPLLLEMNSHLASPAEDQLPSSQEPSFIDTAKDEDTKSLLSALEVNISHESDISKSPALLRKEHDLAMLRQSIRELQSRLLSLEQDGTSDKDVLQKQLCQLKINYEKSCSNMPKLIMELKKVEIEKTGLEVQYRKLEKDLQTETKNKTLALKRLDGTSIKLSEMQSQMVKLKRQIQAQSGQHQDKLKALSGHGTDKSDVLEWEDRIIKKEAEANASRNKMRDLTDQIVKKRSQLRDLKIQKIRASIEQEIHFDRELDSWVSEYRRLETEREALEHQLKEQTRLKMVSPLTSLERTHLMICYKQDLMADVSFKKQSSSIILEDSIKQSGSEATLNEN